LLNAAVVVGHFEIIAGVVDYGWLGKYRRLNNASGNVVAPVAVRYAARQCNANDGSNNTQTLIVSPALKGCILGDVCRVNKPDRY
jgi:hypothetical protein